MDIVFNCPNCDQEMAVDQSGVGTEIDEALSRLSVWRALLGVATAAGDLQPFLSEASQ